MKEIQVSARVHGSSSQEYDCSFDTVARSRGERIARSLACFLGCWTLAVPLVFVPVIHFFLVPPLLIAGPLLGFLEYNNRGTLLPAKVNCPDCREPVQISKRRLSSHFYSACDSCGQNICFELLT